MLTVYVQPFNDVGEHLTVMLQMPNQERLRVSIGLRASYQ